MRIERQLRRSPIERIEEPIRHQVATGRGAKHRESLRSPQPNGSIVVAPISPAKALMRYQLIRNERIYVKNIKLLQCFPSLLH
jgi:hypothetical protein